MVTKNAAHLDIAIPPGDYLAREVATREITRKELAKRIKTFLCARRRLKSELGYLEQNPRQGVRLVLLQRHPQLAD
jgi:hypothetical protein